MKKIIFLVILILTLVLYACSENAGDQSLGMSSGAASQGESENAQPSENESSNSTSMPQSSIGDESLNGSTPPESQPESGDNSSGSTGTESSDASVDNSSDDNSLTDNSSTEDNSNSSNDNSSNDNSSNDNSTDNSNDTSSETSSTPPDTSVDDPDTSVDDPDTSVDDPDTSVDDPDTSVDDPDTSVDNPDTSVDDPDTSVDDPDTSVDDPDTSVDDPDTSVDDPDTSVDDPDTSVDDPDTSVDDPDTSVDDPDKPDKGDTPPMPDASTAELLPTGYLIYNGAAYTRTNFSAENSKKYADVYARYAQLFPNTRISVINPPQSAINIINPEVAAMMGDPGAILDQMEADIYGNVNFVNLKDTFVAHRGEYLYFKSDYHWTQLGAYYSYCEFAKSIGITPLALSDFEAKIITDSFIGRAYDYAQDERILSFYDTIYAYMPTKSHTMTVYNSDGSVKREFSNCIRTSRDSYSCFIDGDNPITIIDVPENSQDKTVIVIKESSANAFVPFLTEHYGKIIVIDPRHIMFDISDMVEEYQVDDIIFFAMSSTANRVDYCNYYRGLIGE